MTDNTQSRKADHIRICLEETVGSRDVSTGLEHYRFRHCALPEVDYDRLDLSTTFLGKSLPTPILISSMTGGTDQAQQINQRLATLAQRHGFAMGVGSQRVLIEKPEVLPSFAVRHLAPDILLLANVGAVQLNYGYGVAECQRLVDLLEADALILHFNPLQECIQPQGDRQFAGLLPKIEGLCDRLSVPVIAKEVGNGISTGVGEKLLDVGVKAIDVAGAGGTSWARVEGQRSPLPWQQTLGERFGDWGIPTADALIALRQAFPYLPLIASGGLRTGTDLAKCLALGADLGGFALPFLQAAHHSPEALEDLAQLLLAELRTILFCTDSHDLTDLRRSGVLC